MKNYRNYILFTCALLLFISGCQDDAPATSDTTELSGEATTELIAASLAESTSGLTTSTSNAAMVAELAFAEESSQRSLQCGYEKDTTILVSRATTNINIDFSMVYGFSLTCAPSPQINASLSYEGSYEGPKLTARYDGEATMLITQTSDRSIGYLMNGVYTRNGASTYQGATERNGHHVVVLTLEDITMDKTTYHILEGNGTVTLTGSNNQGDFSGTAAISFLGEQQALVTVRGTAYLVDLTNGEISQP